MAILRELFFKEETLTFFPIRIHKFSKEMIDKFINAFFYQHDVKNARFVIIKLNTGMLEHCGLM
jgi:hypothetical protein